MACIARGAAGGGERFGEVDRFAMLGRGEVYAGTKAWVGINKVLRASVRCLCSRALETCVEVWEDCFHSVDVRLARRGWVVDRAEG